MSSNNTDTNTAPEVEVASASGAAEAEPEVQIISGYEHSIYVSSLHLPPPFFFALLVFRPAPPERQRRVQDHFEVVDRVGVVVQCM